MSEATMNNGHDRGAAPIQSSAARRPRKDGQSASVLFDEPGPRARRLIAVGNTIGILVLLAVAAIVLMRLANPPQGQNQLSGALWGPAVSSEAWVDFYLPGLVNTVRAAVVAVVGAVLFGIIFGIGRLMPLWPVRWICSVVVEFCRAVPVLLFMIFFWRWFAALDMGDSASFYAVVVSLILYNGSVIAELVRSGVGNLPKGQREAAVALGMSPLRSLISVEVPQAIIAMLPAGVTQLVVVLKDTALGSIIMYTDLLQQARRLGSAHFNILQTLVVAAVVYFIICWLLSRLAEWLPEHMQRRTAEPAEPEAVATIAILDPSNVNQIAVAREIEQQPLGGAPRQYHVHHRGTNASIHDWRRTRYVQGYDETHPESQAEIKPSGQGDDSGDDAGRGESR
jgi:glutamate transport system permease protein